MTRTRRNGTVDIEECICIVGYAPSPGAPGEVQCVHVKPPVDFVDFDL